MRQLADGSMDAVVSTLVLCSVESPKRVLQEVRRVLRPVSRKGRIWEWSSNVASATPVSRAPRMGYLMY